VESDGSVAVLTNEEPAVERLGPTAHSVSVLQDTVNLLVGAEVDSSRKRGVEEGGEVGCREVGLEGRKWSFESALSFLAALPPQPTRTN